MAWISKEELKEIRKVTLFSYLERNNPDELKRVGNGEYKMKSHDSLQLSEYGPWHRFSDDTKGRSALDYLIKVEGLSLPDAAIKIKNSEGIYVDRNSIKDKPEKPLILPSKALNNKELLVYLNKRGIDLEIINYFLEHDLMYQSKEGNIIFLGYEDGKVKFAESRNIGFDKREVKNVSGSKKEYSFKFVGNNKEEVHVFEGPIDLLSFATLAKLNGKNWKDYTYISLSGVGLKNGLGNALMHYLDRNKDVKKILLHLDNDMAGKRCTEKLFDALSNVYEIVDQSPTRCFKDCNEQLMFVTGKKFLSRDDDIER